MEVTKPTASRFVSAEIFAVCQRFTAPEYIDDKLFDTRHVFKDSEADLATIALQKEINSIDKILQKRRHRTGYAEDAPTTVYKGISLTDFLHRSNPYPVFLEYNKITIDEKEREQLLPLAK